MGRHIFILVLYIYDFPEITASFVSSPDLGFLCPIYLLYH